MQQRTMITFVRTLAVMMAVWMFGIASSVSASPPPELERTEIVSNLNQPTAFRHLPDGRILISEKGGAIKVYDSGHVQSEPLITLVVLQTDTDEERGLLGIEPDPNFAANGYLYVSYTTASNRDRLSRITVVNNKADPASEVVLIESNQDGNIYHHGGEIRFGPDGKIYWAMGMNTYNPNSQNLSNVHGKILRLNPDGSAPADNPFVATPSAVTQIWAYGLRNPFRFNFTPNGRLMAGDVGGDAWEELNIITRGGNYGWPLAEGACNGCPYVNPVYTYAHTPAPAKAGSITSVMTYTGTTFPVQYKNKVFIADYTLGFIKYLTFDTDYSTFIGEGMFDPSAGTVVQLDQGPDGNIYQMNIYPGALYKISPSGGNRAPTAVVSADKTNGPAPLTVNFSGANSADPEGAPLTYQWDFGDGTTSALLSPTKTYQSAGTFTATLSVSDGTKSSQATQQITVGSTPPTATITSPTDKAPYSAGDTINFTGTGGDAEDASLPDSAYTWRVDLQHADHKHPFRDSIVGKSGSFQIPRSADNTANTWYRLYLTVTDSSGLATTTSIDILPRLVTLTFSANFPDASFTVDGIPKTGNFSEQGVVGVQRVLDVPSPQYITGGQYHFSAWSDGQPQSHAITTPAQNASYQATFTQASTPPEPWKNIDVGTPTVAGYASYDNNIFTVRGAGGDIWGPTDQFHYVYQPFSGDGEIIARVTSQTKTDDWAKSGIMIKESTAAGSKYVLLAATPANGITFQYNFNGDGGSTTYAFPNAWLKLKRVGNTFTAYTSTNGSAWTTLGQTTLPMSAAATAGLAVSSHKFDTLNTTVFDNVSVAMNQEWSSADIGNPRTAGSTSMQNGTFTLTGAGDDIWGTADQLRATYQKLPGDGEIVARVTSHANTTDGWAKAGVIIKQSTTAGSPYALLATTPANGINFQHSFNSNTTGPAYAFPDAWLKLKRTGSTITSFTSTDGQAWQELDSATISLTGEVIAGVFVSSHNGSQASTATFDNVTLTRVAPSTALPAPWTAADVGTPKLAGSAKYTDGIFTINGAGDDIWADADQFHFVHQGLSGDGEVVARVTAQANTDNWAKSGIMIKSTTTKGSPYILLAVTPANNLTLQHSFNQDIGTGAYALPNAWLKLTRVRDVITAYRSADGANWTQIGTATLGLGTDVRIGLFVTSHNGSKLNESKFDNVTVRKY
jgi:glucose/arabinose dehydrogenase/regulation of enolase protein 1 (concanavalin A-like superfamily)